MTSQSSMLPVMATATSNGSTPLGAFSQKRPLRFLSGLLGLSVLVVVAGGAASSHGLSESVEVKSTSCSAPDQVAAASVSLLQAASLLNRQVDLSGDILVKEDDMAFIAESATEDWSRHFRHSRNQSAEEALKSAVGQDPTESGKWSLTASTGAFQFDFCAVHAQAMPMCAQADIAEHKDQLSATSGFVSNLSWVHLSNDGLTCLSKAPLTSTASSLSQLVIDDSILTTASPTVACDTVYDDAQTLSDYEGFYQSLLSSGKASFEAYPFEYSYKDSRYNGSMRFAWFMPPVDCPAAGCQVLVYLHGLNILSQMGHWGEGESNDLERLSLRPACEHDYKKLRSIVTAPMLEPKAFPNASKELISAKHKSDFWDFELRVSTRYLWHARDINVFGDAVIPILKQLLTANAAHVDQNRVHLVGFSMGGVGAMVAAFNHMDMFASVMAVSPCVMNTSHFPDWASDWIPEQYDSTSLKRLNRILMFIGEEDTMYEESSAKCVDAWSQMLALARERGLISLSDQIEIHYMRDTSADKNSSRSHSSGFRYAMSEMDALLWQDKGMPHTTYVPGCSADLRWIPLAILMCMTLARCGCSSVTKDRTAALQAAQLLAAVPKASEEGGTVDVVADADELQAKEAEERSTYATGQLAMSPQWITTLPDLISSKEGCAFLGCKEGDPPVSFIGLRDYLTSDEVANALPQGLRYALSMPAGRDFACSLLAVMHRGTAAPLDPTMTSEELCPIYAQLKINAVVCAEGVGGDTARMAAARMNLPVLEVHSDDCGGAFPKIIVREVDRLLLESSCPALSWDIRDVERVVLMLRTSGTTSKGKVVPFGFRRLAFAAQYNASCLGLTADDVCLSMMPLFHIAGISVNLLPSLHAGSTVLLLDRPFEAPYFVAQLERKTFQPTWYFAVPAVHKAVLTEVKMQPGVFQHRLRLIRSAGAALEKSLGEELVSFFNVAVTPCYGMTEACEITCPPKDYRLEKGLSVGPPMTCTISIDTSMDPQGRTGEICVKGDLLMQGYEWNGPSDEDPNKQTWTEDGFLRTGDVGYLDADGWLTLTGRSKEMINRGGETLSPYEVEDALRSHPSLSHVLAFAAPHTSLGECIAVACVLKAGSTPATAGIGSLHQECQANGLRKVMWPEAVVYCSDAALPKTRTKKYIRTGLAGKIGLSASMLASGARTFVLNDKSGELVAEPSADEETVEVQDSMMQSRRASRMERISHNATMSLYGIVLINVMLNHWLPHDMHGLPVESWVRDVVNVFRSDKALMGLMFLLSGSSVAMMDIGRLLPRCGVIFLIYFLMGWPLWSAQTATIATFHRWFLLYLGYSMLLCIGIRCSRMPPWVPLACLLVAPPLFSAVPDDLGEELAGFEYASVAESSWALLLNSSFFWSIAHKLYWAAFFVAGFFYGPTVQTALWSLSPERKALLTSIPIRIVAFTLACSLVYCLVSISVTHNDQLQEISPSLVDWPNFFIMPWYPFFAIMELAHLALLGLAIGEGSGLLQAIGSASLATFILHMYFDTGIWLFLTSRTFQELDFAAGIGPVLQLSIIFAYPVCFGLTVGPALTWLARASLDLTKVLK